MITSRSILASSALACSLLTGLAQAEDAIPGGPDRFLVGPTVHDTAEGLDLEILWTATLSDPTSTTLDLSTDVFVQIGDYSATQTVRLTADPGAGFNPDGTFGGPCGTGSIDGVPVELVDLSEGGGSCQFPWIKTSFPGVPAELFDAHDLIEVRIVPSSGSVPELDPSNDFTVEPVGGSAFYDRAIVSVQIEETDIPDAPNTIVDFELGTDMPASSLDLRTDIVVNHNGKTTVYPAWCGPWITTELANCVDCSGETCATIECGGETVTKLTCQPYENAWGQFDCACVSDVIRVVIPGIQLKDGDTLEISLTHAPGAMPELEGLDDDTWTFCGDEAQSKTYGTGKAGTFGVPHLESLAKPVLGQLSGLSMKDALPGATPVLFLGFSDLAAPFAGGTLLVDPAQVLFLPAAVAADGTFALPALLPADPALCGVSAFFQMMFLDPGAAGPKHVAMTNGLNQVFGM